MATAIAIGFTLYDHQHALARSEQKARDVFGAITSGLPLTGQASMGRIEKKIQDNTMRVSKYVTRINAVVLIVATLVWGFGDLAAELM